MMGRGRGKRMGMMVYGEGDCDGGDGLGWEMGWERMGWEAWDRGDGTGGVMWGRR